MFGSEGATRLLFFHIREEHYPIIKPFLVMLNIMPNKILNIKDEEIIDLDLIGLDPKIVEALRVINNG